MRFRWKLLILLLAIALLPITGLRLMGMRNVRSLADKVIYQAQEYLVADTKNNLRLLVDSYSAWIWQGRENFETALMFQAREVERALTKRGPVQNEIYFSHVFNQGHDLPSDTTPSTQHFLIKPDGSFGNLSISHSNQIFSLAPGTRIEEVELDIARLSTLTPFYHQLYRRFQGYIFWHYTSLENGLHCAYPAHSGFPPKLDSREGAWYKAAFNSPVPWSEPYVDPATRDIVIAASMQIKRPNGEIAGATSLVLSVDRFFENTLFQKRAPPGTQFFFVYLFTPPDSRRSEVRIFAQVSHTDKQHRPWNTAIDSGQLISNNTKEFQAMINDFKLNINNTRKMDFMRRDSLWTYGATRNGAYLVLITPYQEILKPAHQAEVHFEELMDNLAALTNYTLLGAGVFVFLLALAFSRTVTKPIDALLTGSKRLARGKFDTRVDIRSRDEFGTLGKVFNSVVPRLHEHYQMTQSMTLAKEVQQNLLPRTDPEINGLDIAGKSIYCEETGGDYYDYLNTSGRQDKKISIVVGDVSDHGIPSALMMTTVRAILRQRASLAGSVAGIVSDVNKALVRDIHESGQFITLFFIRIDLKKNQYTWVRAGHDSGIVYDPDSDRFVSLDGKGIALGVTKDFRYKEFKKQIVPGQIVLIGTDGIWETHNIKGEAFGKERLRRLIREHSAKTANGILNAVIREIEAFRSQAKQMDDITLVVIKVKQ